MTDILSHHKLKQLGVSACNVCGEL